MYDQEYILLILNCKKYVKKALFQKMTWLKYIPEWLQYYHVIGDETLESDFKFDDVERILWIKVGDDYNSLPKKVIRAYKAINETFNYKYIFKTDDDQILVNNKYFDILKNILKTKNPISHYGGYIVDVKESHISKYYIYHPELPKNLLIQKSKYCSGRFYFLSKESIKDLLLKKDIIEKEYLEDYAIGFHLDEELKQTIFSIATNKIFTDIELSDYPRLIQEGKI